MFLIFTYERAIVFVLFIGIVPGLVEDAGVVDPDIRITIPEHELAVSDVPARLVIEPGGQVAHFGRGISHGIDRVHSETRGQPELPVEDPADAVEEAGTGTETGARAGSQDGNAGKEDYHARSRDDAASPAASGRRG